MNNPTPIIQSYRARELLADALEANAQHTSAKAMRLGVTDWEFPFILPSVCLRAIEAALSPPEADIVERLLDEATVDLGAQAIWLVGQDWNSAASWSRQPEYGQDLYRDYARACLGAAIRSLTSLDRTGV